MKLHIIIREVGDYNGQIYRQISDAIETGRLIHGQQVPPSRLLARQLGVTRKSVADAYRKLTYDKKLVGFVGKGTFVHRPSPPKVDGVLPMPLELSQLEKWYQLDDADQLSIGKRCAVDFSGGEPATDLFPKHEWRRCIVHALRKSSANLGRYSDPAGLPDLREALMRHAAFSRGLAGDAAHLVVTSGAQQALDLIGRILIEPGTCVAVEDPGYPRARLLFASLGARVVGVPVLPDGIDVDAIPSNARLIYVTPAHQFPLGMAMSTEKRQALLCKAAAIGAVIIEDDYDSEFRYLGRPADSLQSMDTQGVVLFVGTLSKVMFPALRIGYVLAPPAYAKALATAKKLTDWHCNTLVQHALTKFVSEGNLMRHIRRVQPVYAQRREKIQRMFNTALAPWFKLISAEAGFHMVATCSQPMDVGRLIATAAQLDVRVYPLAPFYCDSDAQDGLFLGYGAVETDNIEPALLIVRDIIRKLF